ncbi:hypothetical protein LINGRAPRIM_LOCUS2300 [Linum grandiflorum]
MSPITQSPPLTAFPPPSSSLLSIGGCRSYPLSLNRTESPCIWCRFLVLWVVRLGLCFRHALDRPFRRSSFVQIPLPSFRRRRSLAVEIPPQSFRHRR